MKRLIVFIFPIFLLANIFSNSNVKILKSLDIESEFIKNPKLQEIFNYYYKYKRAYIYNIINNGYELIPILKNEIKNSNLPKELVTVAMAESYMNLEAKSNKKAVGLWQFMSETARRFGLRIDEYVDERRDVYKSTKAAIEYLKYLHNYFGKWYLAIMAYNAGEARVVEGVVRAKVDKLCKRLGKNCYKSKTIKKYRKIIKDYQHFGSKKYTPLYKLYKKLEKVNISLNDLLKYQKGLKRQYIPKETRKYILKVLSISFLYNKEKFSKLAQEKFEKSISNPTYISINVPAGTSLFYVSKILNEPYKKIRNHNLHLNFSFTPPYKYYIYIPADRLALFNIKFNPRKRKYVFIYKVKKGDTLLKIAKKFDVKVSIIRSYNKLGKYLRVGEKIFIPLDYKFVKYRVKKGDSILKIAKKFGISYKKIIKFNNLNSSVIRVGQILKIPQRL